VTEDCRPRLRPPRIRFHRRDGGVLLYDVAADAVFQGSELTLWMLRLCNGRRTCRQIARALSCRTGGQVAELLSHVLRMARRLERQGLLERAL
jgi:hypothetical protein